MVLISFGVFFFMASAYGENTTNTTISPSTALEPGPATAGLGEKCTPSVTCIGYGVNRGCINGTCQCLPHFEVDSKNVCKPIHRYLGDKCTAKGDCHTAFSTCTDGTCQCRKTFKRQNAACVPLSMNCIEDDKPLSDSKSPTGVLMCTALFDPKTGQSSNDSCPKSAFCNLWQGSFNDASVSIGHCCPKSAKAWNPVTASCPVGQPHKTGVCLDILSFPGALPWPEHPRGPMCPTSYAWGCVRGVCCPQACKAAGHVNVGGQCYDMVLLGEPCVYDVQCVGFGVCTNGTCACKSGDQQISSFCVPSGQKTDRSAQKIITHK